MKSVKRIDFYFYILNGLICLYLFLPIIFHLNTVLLSWGGDGLKNYYNYLYFVTYDHGTTFTGMNYPYGENIIFTDNMPVLSWSIAQLRSVIPGISSYALLLMHGMMVFSYFVAACYIYKILKLYDVKNWWALFSAIFIAYFSPQFTRLGGHFSLSLVCYIPMIIYWFTAYKKTAKLKYPLFLYFTIVFFSFCHVYFLAMTLVFTASYCVASFLISKQKLSAKLKSSLPLVSAVLLAIFTFKLYLSLTDTVDDRPKFPIGFLNALTTWQDLLTTPFNFIGSNVFTIFSGGHSSVTEGYAYLGFTTSIILLFTIYRIIRSLFLKYARHKTVAAHPVRIYRVWLLTSLFCLLFAMGVPFSWGGGFITDYFSTFRQFRTLGRFSWIFYYLAMIYASIFLFQLYHFHAKKVASKNSLRVIFIAIIIAINIIELNGYIQHVHEIYTDAQEHYAEYFNTKDESWKQWMVQKKYAPNRYQAIIGIPFFHIGSEQLGLQDVGEGYTLLYGSQMAFQTGTPMSDVMMSRTSWSQTYNQVQLIDGPFSPKPLFEKYNNKPVLLLVNKEELLLPGEAWLVSQGDMIANRCGLNLIEININTILTNKKIFEDSIASLIKNTKEATGLIATNKGFYYNNHFDNFTKKNAFVTSGAYNETSDSAKNTLISFPVSHPTDDTAFVISAWIKNIDNSPEMPFIMVEQYDQNNKKIYDSDFITGHSTYHLNGWFKGERIFYIAPQTTRMVLYIHGGKKNCVAVDELLIRPTNAIHFSKLSDQLYMINNRPMTISK